MLLAGIVVSGFLAARAPDGLPPAPAGPRLEVLQGTARVLAGEAWLALGPGRSLPEPPEACTLRLEWNSRARLSADGATIELAGPLDVQSTAGARWKLSVAGGGGLRVDARSTAVEVELESCARLDLRRGTYWAESVSSGGWRVGCDAGEPLALRAPDGARWGTEPRVACGAQLRLVPARFAGPLSSLAGERVVAPPWRSFAWPWTAGR
jgi:hypothetical protein